MPYFAHRVVERDARKRRLDLAPDRGKHRLDGAFDDAVDELLGGERDLDVDLRELGLAIGAEIFVAEAAARSGSSDPCPAIIRICLKICGDCGSAKNSPGCTRLGTR